METFLGELFADALISMSELYAKNQARSVKHLNMIEALYVGQFFLAPWNLTHPSECSPFVSCISSHSMEKRNKKYFKSQCRFDCARERTLKAHSTRCIRACSISMASKMQFIASIYITV